MRGINNHSNQTNPVIEVTPTEMTASAKMLGVSHMAYSQAEIVQDSAVSGSQQDRQTPIPGTRG
jgi:hypothetical protein